MSIKALPSMESTFTLDVKGSETNQAFSGTFTYKRPNLKVKSEIAKTKARLNEDLRNLDEDTQLLHEILATLKHTLIKTPDWWQQADYGYDLYDVNVPIEIYKHCQKFEKEFFDLVWKGDEKAE